MIFFKKSVRILLLTLWFGVFGQLVAADRLDPDFILKNEKLVLGFNSETLSLVNLTDPESGHEFLESLSEHPVLWSLDMEDQDGATFQIQSSVEGTGKITREGDTLILTWSGVEVAGEKNAMEVRITVELPKDSDRSYWRIEVDNDSKSKLVNVMFPYIDGLSKEGQPSAAVPRHNWGNLEEAVTYTRGSYPSVIWPMQFLALLEENTGLYLAFEDPRSVPKYFDLRPGVSFFFTSFAENSTTPGNDFASTGPVAIGVCGPSWWNAAKMYRSWAVEQPWTSRGPLTKPSNVPERAKDIGIWFNDGLAPHGVDSQVDKIEAAENFFQLPMAMQLYVWHRAPFDTEYPEYFPAKPEFAPIVKVLVERGAFVAPYINGRLQDLNIESTKAAKPFLVRKLDGTAPVEDYQSGAKLGVMCPATIYWQTVMLDVSKTIAESGANAIYFDQISAAEPYLCFDPGHGHPLGGGSYWIDGYRKMLEGVKQLRTKDGTPLLVASENTTESYMDVVDAFLTWTPRAPSEIPLLTAVYSGYAIYFGSNAQVEDDSGLGPFAMIVGRDMLWGTQPGWMAIDVTSERGQYLRDVAKVRHAKRRFFQYGELVGELNPTNDPGTTTGKWKNINCDGGGPTDVTIPAVMSSLWKSPEGDFGIAIANLSGEERTFSYKVRPLDYGVVLPAEGYWNVTQTHAEGEQELQGDSSLELTREEKLKPWEFHFIEVLPKGENS